MGEDYLGDLDIGTAIGAAVLPMYQATAPRSFTAAVQSDTQINLSWNTPASSGTGSVINYDLGYKLSTDTTWQTATTTSRAVNIPGLTQGNVYQFRVAATNALGLGVYATTTATTGMVVPSSATEPRPNAKERWHRR